jgi:hypothetical protein
MVGGWIFHHDFFDAARRLRGLRLLGRWAGLEVLSKKERLEPLFLGL